MKKIFTLFAALLIFKMSFATIHEVSVSDFQFSPANINVIVGDTVKWTWVSGFHTTSSTGVPGGAATWDANINSTSTTFSYKVTVAGAYTYQCNIHPTQMQGTINASNAMPVVLSSFVISPMKTNGALLSWVTAIEQNTDHFEIMRSTNGSNFENIGSVAAKGNSATATNYSFTDNGVPNNYRYIYYYLSIVDKDGRKTLSDIALFRNVNGSLKLIVSLSPNPISRPGHLMLQFNSDKANSMHVQLFDGSGKLVKEADMTAVAGLNNGHFHIGDVSAGTYTIIFTMDGVKESYRLVIQ
jgi:plastocyanin